MVGGEVDAVSEVSAAEDLVGLVVPRWRVTGEDGVDVVDLSTVGCVLVGLASRTGCRGIGVEASARLVARARAMAGAAGVDGQVLFLHELIGRRGLRGASVVYCWLLPGSSDLVRGLVEEVLAGGGDFYRGLVVVGEIGDLRSLGSGQVIGEIPDRGRIRNSAGVAVRWLPARSGASV